MRAHRVLTAFVAVGLLAAGCTGGSARDGTAATAASRVDRLRALPFDAGAESTVTGVLAGSGVGVYDDAAAVTSGRPVRVTTWQVRNLAVEAADGGGVRGSDLDGFAAAPVGSPAVSYLVAAWVTSFDSPGARFARELLGEQDWTAAPRIRYPGLVLTLFLADATAGAPAPVDRGMVLSAYAAGGPCTFASTFIQNAIVDVAAALKVDTSGGGFLGFLGKIWNVAVDLASGAVAGLIDTVTRPVVSLIADAFGVVATIVQVSSFLAKWRATVEAKPSHTRFGVDAESVRGDFVLTVAQDQPPIPDIVLDCADAVHVDLRDAGSAAGSKVTWTEGRGDLSTRVSADPVLARDKTADYRYETMRESAELAASPETESPALVVQASVRRNDVEKARDLFTKLLLDQIPGKAGSVVRSLAKPLLDAATDRLDALTDETATGRTFVTYHTPPAKQSPAPGGSSPAPANTVVAHFPTRCPGVDKIAIASPRPNNGGPWVFDGDILPPKSLPKGAFTCGYSAPLGGVDPVTGYQTAEQIGLFIFPDIEPMPAGAKPVTVRGADQAWWEGGILKVVVGDRTLGVSVGLRVTANQIQQGVSVAEEVLGTR